MDVVDESALEEPLEPATEQARLPEDEVVNDAPVESEIETAAEVELEVEPEPEPEPAPDAEPAPEPEVEVEPEPAAEPEPEPASEAEPDVELAPDAEPDPELEDLLGQIAEPSPRVPWWPFLAYGVLWIGLVVYAATQISTAETAMPAVEQAAYPYVVLAGLVLALLGPLASIVVWVVVWKRAGAGRRGGLFTSAFVRGSVATLLGVAVWWGALYVLDALRLGLIGPLG